ncbi:podocan isoform X2 [Amblyraja radiata]|uniref:podocan isoform X2 n=1 Tax=Amblyraja radiata TaxID=386614 RepID=UPI0014028C57|nr:podocan isoform X2 [Amblyraja radiata]
MNWSSWQPVLLWLLSFSCSAISEENHAHESVKNHTGEKTDLEKQVDSCPADCVCNLDGTVDCGGVDLKEFPKNLSQSILHLSLQNNALEVIPLEELSRLQSLETFNLQNNRLSSKGLPDDAFHNLKNLRYLYLANNKLTVAPKYLPKTLISADLAANYLTKIYPLTFGQKPNLRSVYLHNNKLTDAGLPDHMFNASDGVGILIMSSNFLKYVPKNLPKGLFRLHLKNNKLEKIPKGAFENLSNLRELYLHHNYITNEGMDNETFWKLSSLEYLDLSCNNITQIPSGLPRNIILLHLEKNAIKTIPANWLTQIKNLEYLLLHNNKIRAKAIHPLAFKGLKKLHTFHLYNNMLERIPSGLPRRVKTLMLLHNQISEISRNDFAYTYFLTELNLSYNKLTSSKIHPEAFRKMRLLESLDFSGNNLNVIPRSLPKNLHILKLKENEINSITDGALSGMAKLKELFLSNNKLKLNSVYPGAWKQLSALQLLDLSGNQLSYIPTDLPESLQYIYLQNNQISVIPENAFESTPNIKGIFLRDNSLTTTRVKGTAFEKLKFLQVLDMGAYTESTSSKENITEDDSENGADQPILTKS